MSIQIAAYSVTQRTSTPDVKRSTRAVVVKVDTGLLRQLLDLSLEILDRHKLHCEVRNDGGRQAMDLTRS